MTRAADTLLAVSCGETVLTEPTPPQPCALAKRLGAADLCGYVRKKVRRWGMFTPGRRLIHHGTWVPFGASEMMMRAISGNVVDAAVVACDGVGTLAAFLPALVQGVGARMNGLFHTTAYPELVGRAEELGGLVPGGISGEIDPAAGLVAAAEAGARRIAVTVAGYRCGRIPEVRAAASDARVEVVVLSVCNTGLSGGESMEAAKADIVWGCAAERGLTAALRGSVMMQVGLLSPVWVLTRAGARLFAASVAGAEALAPDGRTLVGTERELPSGEPAGYVGPVRIRVRTGADLPATTEEGCCVEF